MATLYFLLLCLAVTVGPALGFARNNHAYGNHGRLTTDGIKHSVYDYFHEKQRPSASRYKAAIVADTDLDAIFRSFYGKECKVDLLGYKIALKQIIKANVRTDTDGNKYNRADYHFDGEMIEEGNRLVIQLRKQAKKALENGEVLEAREKIGNALHALQDFYSHTNWVEMGQKKPSPGIGTEKGFGVPLAGKKTPTCKPCTKPKGQCKDNIIVTDQLTSGYFKGWSGPSETGPDGESVEKPTGVAKCSHGNGFDKSAFSQPIGGINKDYESAAHGYLHKEAADLAQMATTEFITAFRKQIGDRLFEKFLALGQPKCEKSRRHRRSADEAYQSYSKFFGRKQ